jgi:hypothetical protein
VANQDKQVAAHDNQLKALEFRKAGLPYTTIALQLGYNSPQAAWKAVKTALKRTIQEPADEVRQMEIERLDAVLVAVWAQVKQGNLPAVDRYVKLAQRRAELLGLDAPKRTDITSEGKAITFLVEREKIAEEDNTPPQTA